MSWAADVSVKDPFEKIRSDIAEYGWHCLSVGLRVGESDPDFIPFSYTIGLATTFDHPELIIFGLLRGPSHGILAECVSRLRATGRLPENERIPHILARDLDVVVRPLRPEHYGEYVGTALRFFGNESVRASVVFWPDANNAFPWEQGSEETGQEPLLAFV
jgi:hypothetical protein